MASVAEAASARIQVPFPPPAVGASDAGSAAWYAMTTLRLRRLRGAGQDQFTLLRHDGKPGWRWAGDLADHIRMAAMTGAGTPDDTVTETIRFLAATGNMIHLDGKGKRASWWMPDEWVDVSESTVKRLAGERQAEEEQVRAQFLRLAPPAPAYRDGPPVDMAALGVLDPGQSTAVCRWCPRTAGLGEAGALSWLRDHEREAHPDLFWVATTHICPVGRPHCNYPAPDHATFAGHLVAVHRASSKAYQEAITAQARDLAASLRPGPWPAEAPARAVRPAPSPLSIPARPAAVPAPAAPQAPAPVPAPLRPRPPAPAPGGRVTDDQAAAAAAILSLWLREREAETAESVRLRAQLAAATARADALEAALAEVGAAQRAPLTLAPEPGRLRASG
jgi:hypothetical protein